MRITNFVAKTCRNVARNYHVVLLLFAIVAVSAVAVTAQQLVWSENNQDRSSIVTDKAVARQSFPINYKLFNLNSEPLRQQLFSIVGDKARQQSTIISLPTANGSLEYFEVYEASNFEPELQARFPEIRAFSGMGITDRYATVKLSISPQGIQSMVFRTETDNEFIEPFSQDHNVYAVYKTNREKGKLPWACSTDDKEFFSIWKSDIADAPTSNVGQLKTMRLAQSCNGEYSNFFGATSSAQVALVLAAFNATLTRANGVYEKDLAIHLNLIPNTTAVIYYDPATDPYSTTLSQWNGQLQATLTSVIGEANYDIGHMFGASGGGGNAGCIGCICVDGSKGSGITSPADGIPMGDNFDIDYVVHEVGHQMGANHTFSMSLEGSGQNKEVGSGITIMGYAGITAQDVAPHSIETFHETSIQQIQTNIAGKTCPVTTVMSANTAPVVSPVANYTIPITTPFTLTGSATDAQNDPLTYQWEQNDNSTVSGASSVASPTKLTGPNWLSFLPTTSPTRTFPRLSTVLAGLAVTGPLPGGDTGANIEALSSVSRTLNFRLTVRDNRPYVSGSTIGQTQFTDTTVTVSNAGGPFRVTSANTAGTSLVSGNNYTVTWDVNGTTAAPFNAANVKISFSSDGGQTFPTVLAASTANDGSEVIVVPASQTTTGRIKIEAIGNIFFDINDANFAVIQPGGPAIIAAGAVAITAESCGTPNGNPDPGETVTVTLPLSNNGGSATTNLTATLQATGGVASAVTQNYGAVAMGATVTRSFTFMVSNSVVCGSAVTLSFVITDGATTYTPATQTYTTGTAVVSLGENFDGVTAPALPTGWTNTQLSGTGINWVTTTTTPSSAPNAAFANDIATVNLSALTSPAVTIGSAAGKLKFKNQYNTESTFDGMVLEFSTNNGTTWTDIITGGGSFVSGGYNSTLSTGFSNPLPGRMAWSGNSNGYIDTEVTLPASLNGQSVKFRWVMGADSSVTATGVWIDNVQILGGVTCACSSPGACRIQKRFDYDGDGKADVSVYRPGAAGAWYLLNSGSASTSLAFGTTGDKIVPADYDGDGKTDIAVYRGGTWYLQRSTAGFTGVTFGASTDIPQPIDISGDGKAELVVFRPSTGAWYTYNLSSGATTSVGFGAAGDKPVVGDYDGDCKGDLAVFRPSNGTWYIARSSGGNSGVTFGQSGDLTVPADYDGDGKTDVAVFRNGTWYVLGSTAGFSGAAFGLGTDLPTPADYDGDGKADLAVFRSGTWYIQRTTAGFTGVAFGASTDTPTPYAFVP